MNSEIWGVDVVLLTIPADSSKCLLSLWIARDCDGPFNVSTSFPSGKNIHESSFSGPTDTHHASQNTRPEGTADSLKELESILCFTLLLHFLAMVD